MPMIRLLKAFALALSLSIASGAQEIISQSELMGHLIDGRDASPRYPPLARQARIQGRVLLTVTVDEDGKVTHVQIDSGHPMLTPAAKDTAESWKFRPFIQDDRPMEVRAQIKFDFKLEVPISELEKTFKEDFAWRLERARTLFAENDPLVRGEAEANASEAISLAHKLDRKLEEGQGRLLLARIHELGEGDSSKDFDDALTLFRAAHYQGRISTSSAEWADAHYYAGRCYFRKKDYDGAERALTSAVQAWRVRAPESEQARARLALAASMAAASNLQLNHPRSASFNCGVFRKEKNALHGLEFDEAMQSCAQIH